MSQLSYGFVRPLATAGIPVESADGAAVQIWLDTFGRQVLKGTNIAVEAMDVQEIAPWGTQRMLTEMTTLTAVGVTPAVNMEVYHNFTYFITLTLNGSTSVVVEAEISPDNTVWANADNAGAATTYNADDTYQLSASDRAAAYTRLNWTTENGGAAATIAIWLMLGN